MKLKGYIFSRPFLSERVPQHIQNIVLNDYCKKTKNMYLLAVPNMQVLEVHIY